RELGIHYGPTMQGIEQLSVGKDEVLARLRLPAETIQGQMEEIRRDGASKSSLPYMLHPSMLDAALQAGIGLLGEQNANQEPLVRFALEELLLVSETPAAGWAWVRRRPDSGTGSGSVCDIEVCDDEGRVVVRLRGLSTRPLPPSSQGKGTSTVLLTPGWK